jgi:hypothetical protein
VGYGAGGVYYDLKPGSLAVDSKGNIYMLDFVNNRIQKYSAEGKHLKDIPIDGLRGPVDCWAVKRYDQATNTEIWSVGATSKKPENIPDSNLQAYIWPPEIQGVNIVIDSRDTLYYYLKRTKDSKESGEVWEFRDDKLVRQIETPYFDGELDLRGATIWLTKYPDAYVKTDIGEDYNVFEKKRYLRRQLNLVRRQEESKKASISKNGDGYSVSNVGTNKKYTLEPSFGEEFEGDAIFRDSQVLILSRKSGDKIVNKFNLSGKLTRRLLVKTRPTNGVRDSADNIYQFGGTENGVRIVKYSLHPTK